MQVHIVWDDLTVSLHASRAIDWVRDQLARNPALRTMPIAINHGDCSEPAHILNAQSIIGG